MLLSIDVGIRNLAMCLMNDRKIVQWDVGGVPPLSDDGLYESMLKHILTRPWVLDANIVLIEKQPDKNRKMKSVEDFLHAYFVIQGKKTIIYDARHKIPDISGPGKVRYRQRKNASIQRCREFVAKENPSLLQFFNSHDKKDDLADTVMQALSYNPSPVKVTKKKLTARKPTMHQSETHYSKANLAWLVKNGKHKTDKRFDKDLKRYYTCIDELLSELT